MDNEKCKFMDIAIFACELMDMRLCEYILILKIEMDKRYSPKDACAIPAPYIQIDTLPDQ